VLTGYLNAVSNSYHPHVRMVQRVGEHMLSTVRENSNPFHFMDHDGLLTEFYTSTLTFGPPLLYAQDLVRQIAHRFQSMDILEIGTPYNNPSQSPMSLYTC